MHPKCPKPRHLSKITQGDLIGTVVWVYEKAYENLAKKLM
jgi:hypothetical protein